MGKDHLYDPLKLILEVFGIISWIKLPEAIIQEENKVGSRLLASEGVGWGAFRGLIFERTSGKLLLNHNRKVFYETYSNICVHVVAFNGLL